jgi:uncharacterized protein (DUF885 family)
MNEGTTPPQTPSGLTSESCKQLAAKKFKSSEEKLNAIFAYYWNYQMETYPEWATSTGDPRGQDRLTDYSPEAIASRRREVPCPLELITTVDRNSLKTPSDRLNYDLFRSSAELAIAGLAFPSEFFLVSQMSGIHTDLAELIELQIQAQNPNQAKSKDFENAIARLNQFPKMANEVEVLLREGLRRGLTPPQVTLRHLPEQITPLIEPDLNKNTIYANFQKIPASISEADAARIRDNAAKAMRESVIPALTRYRDFLVKTYIPGARTEIAWTRLPNGPAWYNHLIRVQTTTELKADEIHEIGIRETERLTVEIRKAMKASGWKKDLPAFFDFLRNDPRFFFTNREDLLIHYRDIAKRIDPELSNLFGNLPRLPYGVKSVPAYSEKTAPTAHYESGSIKTGRAGWFVANTYDLKSRPKWEMEALTLHESVPGHHLQLALAQEMSDVPEFRHHSFYGAFIEGWGLYAEGLGYDLGLYRDPYSRVGQLTYEMWRACRLVVDTGIHAKGWSREQAIAFMKSHMPKPLHDIEVEVDRYIVWPGQALTYKMGQLKFKELRERSEKTLGTHFNLRKFHDVLLKDGSLPLNVLDLKLREWLDEQKSHIK